MNPAIDWLFDPPPVTRSKSLSLGYPGGVDSHRPHLDSKGEVLLCWFLGPMSAGLITAVVVGSQRGLGQSTAKGATGGQG